MEIGNQMQNHKIETNSELILWIWNHLIDFDFHQNYRQRYTVIPITTVRGPSKGALKSPCPDQFKGMLKHYIRVGNWNCLSQFRKLPWNQNSDLQRDSTLITWHWRCIAWRWRHRNHANSITISIAAKQLVITVGTRSEGVWILSNMHSNKNVRIFRLSQRSEERHPKFNRLLHVCPKSYSVKNWPLVFVVC